MTAAKMMCARHEQFHEIGQPCPWCVEPEPRRVYSVPAPTFAVESPWMRAVDYGGVRVPVPSPDPWEGLKAWCPRPSGLNSGAAVRAEDDAQTRREMFFGLDRGVDAEMLAGECYDGRGVTMDDVGARIKRLWSKIAEAEAMVATLYVLAPSDAPQTPAGKVGAITQWVDRGYLSRESALTMMDGTRVVARDDCPPGYVYAVQPSRYVAHPSAFASMRVTLPADGGDV